MTTTDTLDHLEQIEPRDGGTPELRRHHEVTDRAAGGGKRVLARLEKLLLDDDIGPAEFEAGRRYADSWNRAFAAHGCACFLRSTPGGGTVDYDRGPVVRLAAATGFRQARELIVRGFASERTGHIAAEAVRRLSVDDELFSEIGKALGIDHKTASRRITKALCLLSDHYSETKTA